MAATHDAGRHVGYLRQVLAEGRRPLGFLLGAGCGMSVLVDGTPIVPDIAGLTAKVAERLVANHLGDQLDKLTEFLSIRGLAAPNVEVLLTHVRLLQSIALDQGVEGFSQVDLAGLESGICDAIAVITDRELPESGTPYHSLAAWAGSIERTVPVEFFTTNYDLLIEQALERIRVPYFDGFVGARRAFLDSRAIDSFELPARWLRLWKLHGSINWFQVGHHVTRTSESPAGATARLIHPSHQKYDESRRMPFLAMMDRLTDFLRQPGAVLISVGYSFGDEHLN
ncbi:MAG: SIR2 family protein, partial [Coriobacteriia bacterium]|nr:SIR2 family protein [Coriobacteriia bacterium]